jgi:hypothetical protein
MNTMTDPNTNETLTADQLAALDEIADIQIEAFYADADNAE